MAGIAVIRSFLLLVAGHTPAHRDIAFLEDHIPLRNRSMAVLAGGARVGVNSVGKEYEARRLVYAFPANFLLICRRLRQSLNMGRIGLDRSMAPHTNCNLRNAHHLAGIGIGVAVLAL